MSDTQAQRLLILDDEEAVAKTIASIAESAGFDVRYSSEPNDFFATLASWKPDHLAVDLVMPTMDGVEVLRRLAAMTCGASIIVTSGMGTKVLEAARATALERGLRISGILPKPFRSQSLRALLQGQPVPTPFSEAAKAVGDKGVAEPELAQAMERGEFVMYFQPKIRLAGGDPVGFEALVRWQHPLRGLLPPIEFIPQAERSDSIVYLTYHFFELAMIWFADVCAIYPVSMAVNLSARNLSDMQLADKLAATCSRLGIDPGRVVLELTETGTMSKPTEAADVMTRLRIKGFKLSIDDFGSGYSSLALLTRLPFSELKIDRTFVQTLTLSGDSRKIVDSTIKLARSLQLTTVAEGIEDLATLALINELGCDVAQGYHFARPMAPQDAKCWLQGAFAERLQIAEQLPQALGGADFFLEYQPQADLASGIVTGMDVHAYWQHPALGRLLDERFLGIAREQNLLLPYYEWLLKTACRQARDWQKGGCERLKITLPLADAVIMDMALVEVVVRTLDETGILPGCVELDIPEAALAGNSEAVFAVLNAIRSLGVHLSVMLVSGGLACLGSLRRLAVHSFRIAPSLLRELTQKADETAPLIAVTSMVHSFGSRLMATGVETGAQCEMLSRNQCDLMQGPLLCAAQPAAAIGVFLAEEHCLPPALLRSYRPPPTLLLVDDEARILSALKRLLRRHQYRLFTASSALEGLEILAGNSVDVIVSDQRMPGMTGIEFLQQVSLLYPDATRLVLSGYTDLESVIRAVNTGSVYKFLTKPWEDAALLEAIEDAVKRKTMADENRRLNLEVMSANQRLEKTNRQLEEVLLQQQQSLHNREVGLRVAYEGLEHVPIPMLGLDDEKTLVFTNMKAQTAFAGRGPLLGGELAHILPEVNAAIAWTDQGETCELQLPEGTFTLIKHCMRIDNRLHGYMLFLLDCAVT